MSEQSERAPRFLGRRREDELDRGAQAGLTAIKDALVEHGVEPPEQDPATYGRRGMPAAVRSTRPPEAVDFENQAQQLELLADAIDAEAAEVTGRIREYARMMRKMSENITEQVNGLRKKIATVSSVTEPLDDLMNRGG